MKIENRRNFMKATVALPALVVGGMVLSGSTLAKAAPNTSRHLLKTSLNVYSFNASLMDKTMTLEDMLAFCSAQAFDAVDITAYYFQGYPQVPKDEYLYHIKQTAFRLGLGISGTGVRNDFTEPNKNKRAASVQLVKNWIEAAEKLGAPVIRIFAGTQSPAGYSRAQVTAWMVESIKECVEHGKKHGVVVALQNHYDFIKTADQVIDIMEQVNSPWFGLILDTGSFRTSDPYKDIEKTIRYAVNWQIKEKIFIDGAEVETDLKRLAGIIKNSSYRGYLPIETLGEGDAKKKIAAMLNKLTLALG